MQKTEIRDHNLGSMTIIHYIIYVTTIFFNVIVLCSESHEVSKPIIPTKMFKPECIIPLSVIKVHYQYKGAATEYPLWSTHYKILIGCHKTFASSLSDRWEK